MLSIHVTVAAIIEGREENQGKFLMVEELSSKNEIVYNQPAGHVETNESIQDAIIREVFEETGVEFNPTALIGTYFLNPADNGNYYLRFCFTGYGKGNIKLKPHDKDIISAQWMSIETIKSLLPQHRSGLILKCLDDYLSGKRYPLENLVYSSNESLLQEKSLDFLDNYSL